MKIRVGFGFDGHQLVTGRELWLGGIKFEHELGLLGHSDAEMCIRDSFSAIYDGTSSRTDGIWSELHEDSRGIRFFSSHTDISHDQDFFDFFIKVIIYR